MPSTVARAPRARPRHLESLEQQALVRWADMTAHPERPQHKIGRLLFAIQNGGKRSKIEASIMKGEGLRAGVPDLMLAWPTDRYPGLFIEMKTADGRVSPEQKDWRGRLLDAGYRHEICRGWLEAKAVIEDYLGL